MQRPHWPPGNMGASVLPLGDATQPVCPRVPSCRSPAHSVRALASGGWLPSGLALSAFSHSIFCRCCWTASWTRASIMASVRTPSSEAYAMA